MPRGVSLHIGLNHVDPNAYGGWDGALSGCLNDAAAMKGVADRMGYTSTILRDAQATADSVIEQIGQAAAQVQAGDIFLLTYSGHGGQVPDANGDEDEGQDETWVLYDRMLLDDELNALWSQFAPGVRVFVLSDSCHSGTAIRVWQAQQVKRALGFRDAAPRFRFAPREAIRASYERQRGLYRSLQWVAGRRECGASILLISGCQDSQLSMDGSVNGLFTEKLLGVWNSGAFQGTYRQFWQAICAQMPPEQTPNYLLIGQANAVFEAERPFTIGGGVPVVPGTSGPSVTGPISARRGDPPPTFTVSRPAGTYFVFEICARPELFDITNQGASRNSGNFYGSWADPGVPARLTGSSFQLPAAAWGALQSNARLYFRVITTTSATGWDGATWSTPDHLGADAPSMQVLAQDSAVPPGPQPQPAADEPVLRLGSKGEAVARLQGLLVGRGYGLQVDGTFGPRTEGAVRDFQSRQGLAADGVVGPQTWAALHRTVPGGLAATGQAVASSAL